MSTQDLMVGGFSKWPDVHPGNIIFVHEVIVCYRLLTYSYSIYLLEVNFSYFPNKVFKYSIFLFPFTLPYISCLRFKRLFLKDIVSPKTKK